VIAIQRKIGPLKLNEKYFSNNFSISDAFGFSVYKYSFNSNMSLFFSNKIFTLFIDLNQSLDVLFNKINKNFRKDIQFCIKNNFEFNIVEDRNTFISFFNEFSEMKGLNKANTAVIESLREHSVITSASKDNDMMAMHFYLVDQNQKLVRCLYSATMRLRDDVDKKNVGKANKYLHFKEMEFFKNEGFEIYDFGGYNMDKNDTSLQGVNTFKERFGGELVEMYNHFSSLFYLRNLIFK
jgi:hypothetical protein